MSSIGASTLKLPVFLGEKRGFRLRIPVGKRFVFQAFPLSDKLKFHPLPQKRMLLQIRSRA